MSSRLSGKRALIVGGTSGIGLAIAREFLREGACLVVAGLFDEHYQRALAELPLQGKVVCRPGDACDAEQVDRWVGEALGSLEGLDILVHTAGGSGRRWGDGSLHECTVEGWQKTLELNLTSVFLSNRAAVQAFRAQGTGGVILNLASMLAVSPSPVHFDTCAYTAAKGGVISLSRLAAARYASEGIRVHVMAPGLIDTPMASRALADPSIQSYLRTKQPLANGPGSAEDCAATAVFLCSDAARFLTGVVLPIDGGWSVSEGQYAGSP
jgi:NAD(P)-dependent dehydrogenase (short-subunit alcohol dehydrogenase family)